MRPAFTIGGAELLVLSLASALPSSRFTSHACALFARAENPLRSELDRLGIPVCCLNGSRLYSPSLLRRLIDYVWREKIDVIHTHLLSADILGRVVGRLCRVPVVSTLHSIPQGFAKMRADRRWLERASALHLTDQLVTVADYARDQFVADWHMRPEQMMVIRNAISVDRFLLVTEPASENIRSHDPVITTIGRLIPDKAQDVLIDAYPEEEYWQDLLKVTGGLTNEKHHRPGYRGRAAWLPVRPHRCRCLLRCTARARR